jgi:hypothetical protein
MERQFMIFNVSEINLIDFTQVMETSAETVRKSVDETKTFVKWEGESIPPCLSLLTTSEGPYGYSEFINILATDVWYNPPKVLEVV